MTNEDKMTVTFTAKELFGQVNDELKEINTKLNTKMDILITAMETKASQDDMLKLDARLDAVEDSIRATDLVAVALKAEKRGRWTRNEKLVGLAYASINIVVGILALGPDIIH